MVAGNRFSHRMFKTRERGVAAAAAAGGWLSQGYVFPTSHTHTRTHTVIHTSRHPAGGLFVGFYSPVGLSGSDSDIFPSHTLMYTLKDGVRRGGG